MNQTELIKKVKRLRQELGLGMMEIKAALEEAKGDEAGAKKILKKKGLKKVEKRGERETFEGLVATYTHVTGKVGAMVELRCETDFVAKNEEFMKVANDLCLQVAAMEPKNTKELLAQDFVKDPTKKAGDLVKELGVKFGEKIEVGKIARIEI